MAAMKQFLNDELSEVKVERNRRSDVDSSEAPHLNLIDGGHTPQDTNYGETEYNMSVVIDGTVTASDDEGLGPAVNALYVDVIRVLMADATLGNICSDIHEGAMEVRTILADESDRPTAEFSLGMVVVFSTPDKNPAP